MEINAALCEIDWGSNEMERE